MIPSIRLQKQAIVFTELIVEINFALPTNSAPAGDLISATGTEGWLSVNQVNKSSTKETIIRTVIKSVVKVKGKSDEEK